MLLSRLQQRLSGWLDGDVPGTGPDILAEGNPERTKNPYMYGMGHDVHSEHTFRPRSAALEIQPRMKVTAYSPKHALTGGGALNVCADSRLQRDRAVLRKSGGLSPSISESLLGDKLRLELFVAPHLSRHVCTQEPCTASPHHVFQV